MRIKVEEKLIEGWCQIPGWRGWQCVIVFNERLGEWHTGSSMCLPSNIEEAKVIHECVSLAFEELSKKLDS